MAKETTLLGEFTPFSEANQYTSACESPRAMQYCSSRVTRTKGKTNCFASEYEHKSSGQMARSLGSLLNTFHVLIKKKIPAVYNFNDRKLQSGQTNSPYVLEENRTITIRIT